jgi:hypothetical protein
VSRTQCYEPQPRDGGIVVEASQAQDLDQVGVLQARPDPAIPQGLKATRQNCVHLVPKYTLKEMVWAPSIWWSSAFNHPGVIPWWSLGMGYSNRGFTGGGMFKDKQRKYVVAHLDTIRQITYFASGDLLEQVVGLGPDGCFGELTQQIGERGRDADLLGAVHLLP